MCMNLAGMVENLLGQSFLAVLQDIVGILATDLFLYGMAA